MSTSELNKVHYLREVLTDVRSYPGILDFTLGCYHGRIDINTARRAVRLNSTKYHGGK